MSKCMLLVDMNLPIYIKHPIMSASAYIGNLESTIHFNINA